MKLTKTAKTEHKNINQRVINYNSPLKWSGEVLQFKFRDRHPSWSELRLSFNDEICTFESYGKSQTRPIIEIDPVCSTNDLCGVED